MQRVPIQRGSRDRHQRIISERYGGEGSWIEHGLGIWVIMAEQEVRLPRQHQPLTRSHGVGNKTDGPREALAAQRAQPGWEEGEGQRVRDGKADGLRDTFRRLDDLLATELQAAQHLVGDGSEAFARGRQSDPMRIAVEQDAPRPFLELADAPAECRLGHVTRLCGAGEVAVFGERQEVLEPSRVHRPSQDPHASIRKRHWPPPARRS